MRANYRIRVLGFQRSCRSSVALTVSLDEWNSCQVASVESKMGCSCFGGGLGRTSGLKEVHVGSL